MKVGGKLDWFITALDIFILICLVILSFLLHRIGTILKLKNQIEKENKK